MASKFASYAKRAPGIRPPRLAVGELRWINEDEELPFVLGAAAEPTQPLGAMHTNLTCAPYALHDVPQNTFMLVVQKIVYKDGHEEQRVTLRAVNSLVLVGQQQPVAQAHDVAVVPRPLSKESKELLYRRISHAVQLRLFAPAHHSADGSWKDISLARAMGSWPRSQRPRVLEYLSTVATPAPHDRGMFRPRPDRFLDQHQMDMCVRL